MRTGIVILFLLFQVQLMAQNTPRYSQFNLMQAVYNPAAIAVDARIMSDIVYRNQWYGVDGAPTTISFCGQYQIDEDMAVGLNLYNDRIGATEMTSAMGQFSYRIPVDRVRYFSFGAGLGINSFSVDLAGAKVNDEMDPEFMQSYSKISFNAAFGILYKADKFYFGASIPQLYQTLYRQKRNEFLPPNWHYYATTGLYLGEKRYVFNPHMQLRVVRNAPPQADLLLRNTFNRVFSLTLGYRTENVAVGGFDIEVFDKFRFGYSFNYSLGLYSGLQRTSHELYLGVGWPYHSGRYHFGERKFVSNKGFYRSDYSKRYRNKRRRGGQ